MKIPSRGVSKPVTHRRRPHQLPPGLITQWNSSLFIGSPTRPRQPSILQFVTGSSQFPNTSASTSHQPVIAFARQQDDQCENLEELPDANPLLAQVNAQPDLPEDIHLLQQISQRADPELQQQLQCNTDQAKDQTIEKIQAINQCYIGKKSGDELIPLQHRINPEIPKPLDKKTVDSDGWGEIDQLSGWDCALSSFPAMEEIPAQHRETWAHAVDTVLRKLSEAQDEGEDLDRALKWWFFLPQALCRKAGRGGRAGIGQIKKRFNCIVQGDFGELVNLWKHDKAVAQKKREARGEYRKPATDTQKKTRQAVSLISKGFISKACNRMTSHGVACIDNPDTIAALKSKYPARGKELPQTVTKGQAVDSMSLRDPFLALKAGVAPGTGQLRPEFLVSLAEVWEVDSSSWDLLQNFSMRHVNGTLPAWYYKCCMSVETVGMFKTAEQEPSVIRPIGMRNPFVKIIHKEVVRQNKEVFTEFLEPQQLGMSVAGGAKLVHSVRMMLENNPDFICIKLDFKNAFNEVYRSRIIEVLENEPSLQHLAAHAATILAPSSGLESRGILWGESHEGTTQGDPESGPYFCIAMQESVRKADRSLDSNGGCARFGWDDGYLIGPTNIVYDTLEEFSQEVETNCGLTLQRRKTEVYDRSNSVPRNGLVSAGEHINDQWEHGMICYGVPIGTDIYVNHMLNIKVMEVEKEVESIIGILEEERQALWSVLRSSIAQKLDYWLTLVYPSLVKEAAIKMDKLEMKVLEHLMGSHIPLESEGLTWDLPIRVPIENLDGRTFQHFAIRQPIKMGGLGIRSNIETSPVAFIGGLEQSLPHLVGSNGVCKNLTSLIGNMKSGADSRWDQLIKSGCRTGNELLQSWKVLQTEAIQCSTYLCQELQEPLSSKVEGLGNGSDDGSTRSELVQQREELRGAVLKEALSRMKGQRKRPVLAWLNRDKLTTSWLQCLPGPNGLSNQAFPEAMALVLCMPSPACKNRIGAKIARDKTVDPYGDNIMSTVLPGDHWRTRHDKLKLAIHSLCTWARLPATAEVFGLFSHLIPAQALTRLERGRKRQALVPDFRLEMPSSLGGTKLQLAELKVLSCCSTWYPTRAGANVRGTDKRARGLQSEYRKKASNIDHDIIGVSKDERGPVERRLEEFGTLLGICFGAWGEASEDVHLLIQALAESRLAFQGLQRGKPGSKAELGAIVGQIRRRLSITAMKAQVDCLLSKIHQVGPGNQQMAKRREWALIEDERMSRERAAQWLRQIEGVHTIRKGFIKTA